MTVGRGEGGSRHSAKKDGENNEVGLCLLVGMAYKWRMSESKEKPAAPSSPEKAPAITVRAPSPESLWAELVVALNYLTRLDFGLSSAPKPRLIKRAMTWFPIVGVFVGTFGSIVDWAMTQIGLPGIITATFSVVSMLWMTRALHEEEFASLANQYGQNFDRDQKIGWLREERSVRYGTLAVILVIIMKIGAIASLSSSDVVFRSLIVAGAFSRALMVVAATWLRPIPGDPVADHFQQPPAVRVLLAVGVACVVTFLLLGEDTLVTLATGTGVGLVVAVVGATHLRGYNGPLLGTIQQMVELTILGVILSIQ